MKLVLDTNVLIAAFAARGLCQAVYELCLSAHEIVLSESILDEVEKNLRKKLKLPASRIQQVVDFIRGHATIVTSLPMTFTECPDPNDQHVLSVVVTSEADRLVTGDAALLQLTHIRGTPIISPRTLWEQLRGRR